jgi:hypothetical protein
MALKSANQKNEVHVSFNSRETNYSLVQTIKFKGQKSKFVTPKYGNVIVVKWAIEEKVLSNVSYNQSSIRLQCEFDTEMKIQRSLTCPLGALLTKLKRAPLPFLFPESHVELGNLNIQSDVRTVQLGMCLTNPLTELHTKLKSELHMIYYGSVEDQLGREFKGHNYVVVATGTTNILKAHATRISVEELSDFEILPQLDEMHTTWSVKSVQVYKEHQKARLQNSEVEAAIGKNGGYEIERTVKFHREVLSKSALENQFFVSDLITTFFLGQPHTTQSILIALLYKISPPLFISFTSASSAISLLGSRTSFLALLYLKQSSTDGGSLTMREGIKTCCYS